MAELWHPGDNKGQEGEKRAVGGKPVKASSRRKNPKSPKGPINPSRPACRWLLFYHKERHTLLLPGRQQRLASSTEQAGTGKHSGNTVSTHLKLRELLAITLMASQGQSSLRAYLRRPSRLPFWYFNIPHRSVRRQCCPANTPEFGSIKPHKPVKFLIHTSLPNQ